MKSRDISLDIIRVIACAMVVAMHSPIPSANANGAFLSALSYFTAPCIGLFFMVSGALLLPVKEDYTACIRRRIGKVIWPTLFWTLIYVAINIYKTPENINITKTLLSIPFSAQGHGVLWFMYTLVGLYLLAPILSAWLDKARKMDLQIVLSLWCITLCYPILEQWIMINESNSGILYYFGGYAGYFLLGFYLRKFPDSISFSFAASIAVLGSVILLLTKYYGIEVDFYRMFWYLSIFVVALCAAIWRLVVAIMSRRAYIESRAIVLISNLSFGIYLCHIIIMRELLWNIGWIRSIENYPFQTFIVFFLTFLLSLALCYLLSKSPLAKWLLGYNQIKK